MEYTNGRKKRDRTRNVSPTLTHETGESLHSFLQSRDSLSLYPFFPFYPPFLHPIYYERQIKKLPIGIQTGSWILKRQTTSEAQETNGKGWRQREEGQRIVPVVSRSNENVQLRGWHIQRLKETTTLASFVHAGKHENLSRRENSNKSHVEISHP